MAGNYEKRRKSKCKLLHLDVVFQQNSTTNKSQMHPQLLGNTNRVSFQCLQNSAQKPGPHPVLKVPLVAQHQKVNKAVTF